MFAQALARTAKFMAIVLLQLAQQVCKLGETLSIVSNLSLPACGGLRCNQGTGCHSASNTAEHLT